MGGEDAAGFFDLGAAGGVAVSGDRVLDHGVGDDQRDVGRDGREAEAEIAAIEQQRVILCAVGGDELIHDAAVGADELIFCALAEPGQPGPGNAHAHQAGDRCGGCDFDRGRTAQAGG